MSAQLTQKLKKKLILLLDSRNKSFPINTYMLQCVISYLGDVLMSVFATKIFYLIELYRNLLLRLIRILNHNIFNLKSLTYIDVLFKKYKNI